MSVWVQGAVLKAGPDQPPLRFVLSVIANFGDDFGFAPIEQEVIAAQTAYHPDTVRKLVKQLEAQGWVEGMRRMMGNGRRSIYQIDLQKLGIGPKKGDRYIHPLYREVQRLKSLLDAGATVHSQNGVLKFEKPANQAGLVESGDLFESDLPPGKMSGEKRESSDKMSGGVPARPGKIPGEKAKTGQNEPDLQTTGGKGASRGAESQIFTGQDVRSDRTRYPVVPDNPSGAFNVFSTSSSSSTTYPTLPPAEGCSLRAEDFSSWSLLNARLRQEMRDEQPVGLERAKGWKRIVPDREDWDACFRDWSLVDRRQQHDATVLVVDAANRGATQAGIEKYAKRLERLARGTFKGFGNRAVRFEMAAIERVDLAASAET